MTTIAPPPENLPDINDGLTYAPRAIAVVNWQAVAFPQINAVREEILTAQSEIEDTVGDFNTDVTAITDNITNINTVAGLETNINIVAGLDSEVAALGAIPTNISTVADNIADVSNVSDNMASILAALDGALLTTDTPTELEMQEGTETDPKAMSPADIAAAIAALARGGGLVPISKVVASNDAAVDIALTGGYSQYYIRCERVRPQNNAVDFHLRTSSNGGSSFDSGASDYSYKDASGFDSAATASFIFINGNNAALGNATGEGGSFEIWIDCGASTLSPFVKSIGVAFDGQAKFTASGGARLNTTAVDAVRLYMSSGNIASAIFHVYAMVEGDA